MICTLKKKISLFWNLRISHHCHLLYFGEFLTKLISNYYLPAKMQALIAKEIEPAERGKVSYEIHWTIPNWKHVHQDVRLVKNLMVIFETGVEPPRMFQTKWQVGLKEEPYPDGGRIRVYWQLLDIKGSVSHLVRDAQLETILVCSKISALSRHDKQSRQNVNLSEIIQEKNMYLAIGSQLSGFFSDVDATYINVFGAIEYRLVLSFKSPDNNATHSDFKRLKMEQFEKRSHNQFRENQMALLREDSNGDLKIETSDGVVLRVHQNILKVQCPVFAGMLNSNLSETLTGVVKVEDVSGKTMRILMHYFYTGDLPNGWHDNDTIVEFTYGAGKYQMSQVLELLDDLLGQGAQDEVSNLDVQLLNLAGKLSLKNAEKRLLQRVIGKVTAAKSGEELFQLFGYEDEEISRKAEMLAGEQIGRSKVMGLLDYTFRSNANFEEDFSEGGLGLLAFVQRNGTLKTLEEILLKRFARIVRNFTTAEEVFGLFGDGNFR